MDTCQDIFKSNEDQIRRLWEKTNYREYGTFICDDNGSYTLSGVCQGRTDCVRLSELKPCPEDTRRVGLIHTHPRKDRYSDRARFSQGDWDNFKLSFEKQLENPSSEGIFVDCVIGQNRTPDYPTMRCFDQREMSEEEFEEVDKRMTFRLKLVQDFVSDDMVERMKELREGHGSLEEAARAYAGDGYCEVSWDA